MVVGGGLFTKLCLILSTPWTVAHQTPLSMGFPRQEYYSGLSFPSLGELPNPGIEPASPALQAVSCIAGRFFTTEPRGKPSAIIIIPILHKTTLRFREIR